MSTLTDAEILDRLESGALDIDPIADQDRAIQPASIDMRLADEPLRQPVPKDGYNFDPQEEYGNYEKIRKVPQGNFRLSPGQFVLASTVEKVSIPPNLVGRVEGRSSLGRIGLSIHCSAGFIDPGFEGHITLELKNHTNYNILLYPEMYIAQLALEELEGECIRPYGTHDTSKYQGQEDATASRISKDYG